MRSKTTAVLLAFFFGGIGLHKFYLGRVAAGLLYMLFFWTLIPAIIAFVEFNIYLSRSERAFNEQYNRGLAT